MSKKNDDFFKEKKAWSEVKDELLGCYLRPYMSKILHTYRPVIYVDCFAGKGRFDDGKPGSPIIALDIIDDCKKRSKANNTQISTHFIDLNYADDLKTNLLAYSNVTIHSGKYEDLIQNILMHKKNSNVFLYIDPYGIKALNFNLFDSFVKYGFNSIELLINMNSFGFIREACRAMGAQFKDEELLDDLVEYEPSIFERSQRSIDELNQIAGGTYWQEIIDLYNYNKISGYDAEMLFAQKYCERLQKSYKYVLNLPLRIRQGQRPKYRLIYATNHQDGCLLMVDNIYNRWQTWKDIQNNGQMTLFDETVENEFIDNSDIEELLFQHLSSYNTFQHINIIMAEFFVKKGAICSTSTVRTIMKNWEKNGRITVVRCPEYTTSGKASTFMDEGKDQVVLVGWNK